MSEVSMNANNGHLLDAALALPEHDRVELVEALIASLGDADRPPLDQTWDEVIQRRSKEIGDESVSPLSWSEVKRQARDKNSG